MLAIWQIERVLEITGNPVLGSRVNGTLCHRSSLRWKNVVNGAPQNLFGRQQQQLGLARMDLDITTTARHLEHEIGNRVQHRTQSLVGLLQCAVWRLNSAHKNGPVQIVVTHHLVDMAQQVERIRGGNVESEKELAQGHHPDRSEKASHIKRCTLSRQTQQESQRRGIQGNHAIFSRNLERGKAC
ncbi:hypothetical protein D3C71_1288750 [compost metagenome]